MKFSRVMEGAALISIRGGETEIRSLVYDSRKAEPGSLFFAIKGKNFDGNRFVQDAIDRGAVAVVSSEPPSYEVPWAQVVDVRRAMATAACNFYGHPSRHLKVVGVTGTNGKTTVVQLTSEILKGGYISTVGNWFGEKAPSALTTPESPDIQRMLRKMVEKGFKYASIEASSHGLYFHRLDGIDFDACVFTNLSGDHLDFHLSMERYFQAKALLFKMVEGPEKWAIINVNDPYGKKLLEMVNCGVLTYSMEKGASIYPEEVSLSLQGIKAVVRTPVGKIRVESPMTGRFNLYNIMASIGAAIVFKKNPEEIEDGIRKFRGVKGRMERFFFGGITVVVDYAHSDDALEKLLRGIREISTGRIILVFGAGGDRDRSKRPRMGRVAGHLADLVIITSDNPRTEDPIKIIREVEEGVREMTTLYTKIPDRKQAIFKALELAKEGDIVVIAGKGHEDYQIIGKERKHFSDQEVVLEYFRGKDEVK